jgi:drug/metabolite transporter (DMT)-like permease
MVVAAGSLLFGGCVLLPLAMVLSTLDLAADAGELVAVATRAFLQRPGIDTVLHVPAALGTLTTNARGYLRIPIGVGLSVLLLGEAVPANLALGLVLVMAGVAATTVPADAYRRAMRRLRGG